MGKDFSKNTTTYTMLKPVIRWAVEAAKEHVNIQWQACAPTDPEWGMGTWQAFQEAFPKQDGIDYDILVTAASDAYSATVQALVDTLPSRQLAAIIEGHAEHADAALQLYYPELEKVLKPAVISMLEAAMGHLNKIQGLCKELR